MGPEAMMAVMGVRRTTIEYRRRRNLRCSRRTEMGNRTTQGMYRMDFRLQLSLRRRASWLRVRIAERLSHRCGDEMIKDTPFAMLVGCTTSCMALIDRST